jgi:hypothetical protein
MHTYDHENLDAGERAAIEQACKAASEAFNGAFQEWKRRLQAGDASPISVAWPLSLAVPESVVVQDKCESRRAEFAELGKQAALATERRSRDAYLELSDDPDELLGKELYFWYVKYRDDKA